MSKATRAKAKKWMAGIRGLPTFSTPNGYSVGKLWESINEAHDIISTLLDEQNERTKP